MKKKSLILLLFIAISFFSCKSTTFPISDINTDFPIVEKLEFKPFNKYDIYDDGACVIDDSILWYFKESEINFGYCYNLNTGEKLATIATKGKASYEFTACPNINFTDDSIHFHTTEKSIKTFAKKDIIDNVPMGERKFSVVSPLYNIGTYHQIKLPNGSILSTILPPILSRIDPSTNEINTKSVVLSNGNDAKGYETINYDSFDIGQVEGIEKPKNATENDQIKLAYANGDIAIKGNDTAVFTMFSQFILYTFDINSGKVVNEKRYTEVQGKGYETTNEMQLGIRSIQSNDKYIYCIVNGFFSKEDKESRLSKYAIFIFDWDLNPIKRFDLPFDLPFEKYDNYLLSVDCSSVYLCKKEDEGITLLKADLNL